MPRSTALLFLALFVVLMTSAACKRTQPRADATIEEAPQLQTMLQMGDPGAAPQLVRGFHEVEGGAWRWTMGRFSIILSPPPGASDKGAKLVLRLGLPEPVIKRLAPVTLSASVEGTSLAAETYAAPGQFVYARDVPPQALAKRVVTVDFALDKFLQPGDVDQRELGVVVTAAGFEPR